ncbi:hypothetical protein [Nocardioides sp. zg-1230]|uniref:hypothetical protein n=1 Tax=Nocardioides sp. zg-1230 TaxID=2736601 RepID=UPI001553D926|nr:hypothetical protein [Nocardioides sp. zg-1230]NPC41196.1 hypothetical protein [Nocardioides sp. zg-1230]
MRPVQGDGSRRGPDGDATDDEGGADDVGSDKPDPRRLTAHEIRARLSDLRDGDDLLVRDRHVETDVDLSFRTLPRVVLVDCDLDGALLLRGSELSGLELHGCRVQYVDLRQSRVTGDLRLVELAGRTPPDADRLTCPVNAEGLRVDGSLILDGSALSSRDEDALVEAAGRPTPLDLDAGPAGVSWDLVLQGVGLASGLAAWVAIVGGGRLWARMEAAGVPALATLAGVGRGWLVAEGLQTLLVPMLLGVVAALTVYFSRRDPRLTGSPGAPADVVRRGQPVAPNGLLSLDRARPVRLVDRFANRTGAAALPLLGLLLALLAVLGILIARASGQVLATSVLGLGAALALGLAVGSSRSRRTRLTAVALAAVTVEVVFVLWMANGNGLVPPVTAALVVTGVAVLFAALLHRQDDDRWAWALLIAASVSGILFSLAIRIEVPWLLAMGAVTVLAIWLALGALADRGPRAAALVVFVAIVAWSGALGFVREIGNRTPDLPLARVELTDGAPDAAGYLLGRSSDHVYLAQDPPGDIDPGDDVDRRLLVIPDGDVERVVIGRDIVLPEVAEDTSSWWRDLGDPIGVTGPGPSEPGPGVRDVEPTGTTGPPPDVIPDTDPADPLPTQPEEQPPFDPATAIGYRDREVGGDRVRVILQAVEHNAAVAYVWVTATNHSQEDRTAADLLDLEAGDFDTVALVDVAAEQLYRVSRREGTCDCAGGLDRVTVPPKGSYGVWAVVVTAPDADTVDVLVPPFGVFRDVAVG